MLLTTKYFWSYNIFFPCTTTHRIQRNHKELSKLPREACKKVTDARANMDARFWKVIRYSWIIYIRCVVPCRCK